MHLLATFRLSGRGAFLPLVWRPAALGALAFLVQAAWLPLLVHVDPIVFPGDVWAATDPELARLVAWHLLFILPPLIGGALVFARSELEAKPFSWTLPGLQRRLRRGILLVAVPVVGGCALLALRTAPAGSEVPMAAAGVAIGLFAFLSPLARDTAFPTPVRWGMPLLWLTVAVRPDWVLGGVQSAPWVASAISLLGASLLVRRTFAPEAARARHLRLCRTWGSSYPEEGRLVRWFAGPGTWSPRAGSTELETGGLLPWIRAAATEGTGGASTALPAMLGVTILGAVFTYLFNAPAVLVVFVAMPLMTGHLRLRSDLLHPLSRRRRAGLAVVLSVVEMLSVTAVLAVAIAGLHAFGFPTLPVFSDVPTMGWASMLALTAAWAPLPQALGLWFPTRTFIEPPLIVIYGPGMVAFGLLVVFSAHALGHLGTSTLVALAAGISTLGYLALWVVIRHRYARIDLVRSAA
jgi:hypothetical protein